MARSPTLFDRYGVVIRKGNFLPLVFCQETLAALVDRSLEGPDHVLTAVLENSKLVREFFGISDSLPSDQLYWLRRGFKVNVDLVGLGLALVDEVKICDSIHAKGWRVGYGLVIMHEESSLLNQGDGGFSLAHRKPVLVLYTEDWLVKNPITRVLNDRDIPEAVVSGSANTN